MQFNDLPRARRLEAAEVASAIDYVNSCQLRAPTLSCEAKPIGDGVALFTGAGSPVNRVQGLGMQQPVTDATVEQAEEFFAHFGEATHIDLCPVAHESLRQLLMTRGYGIELFKNVWWRQIDHANGFAEPNPHLRLEIVTEESALLWAQVVGAAFSGHSSLTDADTSISLNNVYKEQTACFLAWSGDIPAGGGAVAIHDGVAILFSTSVRPALRRMGVQSALLRTRLDYAANAGCDLATVSTTPGNASQRNVERFGFRLAYTKPTMARR